MAKQPNVTGFELSQEIWEAYLSKPDEKTFTRLYDAVSPYIYTVCLRILRNEEDGLRKITGETYWTGLPTSLRFPLLQLN